MESPILGNRSSAAVAGSHNKIIFFINFLQKFRNLVWVMKKIRIHLKHDICLNLFYRIRHSTNVRRSQTFLFPNAKMDVCVLFYKFSYLIRRAIRRIIIRNQNMHSVIFDLGKNFLFKNGNKTLNVSFFIIGRKNNNYFHTLLKYAMVFFNPSSSDTSEFHCNRFFAFWISGFRILGSSCDSPSNIISEEDWVSDFILLASSRMVRSSGFPRFITSPFVFCVKRAFRRPLSMSSIKQKLLVCFPSPYTVIGF